MEHVLHIIDASASVHRAFHAMPPLSRPSDGMPVGALAGFCEMMWALTRSTEPTHRAMALDAKGRTFRHTLYPEYKANRQEKPPELTVQLALLPEAAEAFGLPVAAAPGFEADDVIASLAVKARDDGGMAVIYSSDKDMMQLVGDRIRMFCPMKKVYIERDDVITKWGVPPHQIADAFALIGDSTDNVPGVYLIGKKGAAQLLRDFRSLDGILRAALDPNSSMTMATRRRLLMDREKALLSRELVRLRIDALEAEDLDRYRVGAPDLERIVAFLEKLELVTLTAQVRAVM